MSDRHANGPAGDAASGADADAGVDAPQSETSANRRFRGEREFHAAVVEVAEKNDWECFHIPSRAYISASIPSGFPDLLLRRRDIAGNCHFIAVELKTDTGIVGEMQERFLQDFATIAPSFVLRCKDWDYIVDILENGPPRTEGEIIEPSPPIVRSMEWLPPQRSQNAVVHKIADELKQPGFPRGDLAELRRMDPDAHAAAAFYKLMAGRVSPYAPDDDAARDPDAERKWALIAHGIALMTRTGNANVPARSAHNRNVPVGRALFDGGESGRARAYYSELRLNKLLTARGDMARALLARMFRMMGIAEQSFNWYEMADLILSDGYDEEKAEDVRRKIARSYYQAESYNTRLASERGGGDSQED